MSNFSYRGLTSGKLLQKMGGGMDLNLKPLLSVCFFLFTSRGKSNLPICVVFLVVLIKSGRNPLSLCVNSTCLKWGLEMNKESSYWDCSVECLLGRFSVE